MPDRTPTEGSMLWMLLACWSWCSGRAQCSDCHDYCRVLGLKAVLHRYGLGCAKCIDLLLLPCAYCVCLCHSEGYNWRLRTARLIVCYRWLQGDKFTHLLYITGKVLFLNVTCWDIGQLHWKAKMKPGSSVRAGIG